MADDNGGWPAGLSVTEDDDSITVTDPFGNQLKLSARGIELTSKGPVQIRSDDEITIRGMSVTVDAEIAVDVRGDVRASVRGGSELTLQGATVMIN